MEMERKRIVKKYIPSKVLQESDSANVQAAAPFDVSLSTKKVFPEEVVFQDVEPSKSYEI